MRVSSRRCPAWCPWVLLAGLVCAVGCPAPEAVDEPEPERVVPVETVTAVQATIVDRVVVSGTIIPQRQVDLASEGSGRVLRVAVELGDEVEKGQLLARLDSRTQRAQLRQAKANLRGLEATLSIAQAAEARAARLADQGATSTSNRDLARADLAGATAAVEAAEASVTLAEQSVSNSRLKAPWAGTITALHLEVGSLVAPGQPTFRLVDLGSVRVQAGVPVSQVGRLSPGQKAEVHLVSLGSTLFEGTVSHVGSEADSRSHTYPVEVEVANPDGLLRAGMMGRLEVAVQRRDDAVVVPDGALIEGLKPHVFVVSDGVASRRDVVTGQHKDGRLELRTGVKVGESVVTLGAQHLSDGTRVTLYSLGEAEEDPTTSSGD